MNYYNENNKKAAAWTRQLMADGHIPKGEVDERSITEVQPNDLRHFTQCHFFAGISGWSLALKLAGWPEDREIWTGSCPCQPFSGAGKQLAEADERHLWPEFLRLISGVNELRRLDGKPKIPTITGEQVASALGRIWLAGVRTDLEALAYQFGAADLCAASIGAPHIRQRLFWVADAQRSDIRGGGLGENEATPRGVQGADGERQRFRADAGASGAAVVLGLADTTREQAQPTDAGGLHAESGGGGGNGYWAKFDLLPCSDGKARRIEPGTFPLVNEFPFRVDLLRGFGNAIVPPLATEFIQAFEEAKALRV